MENFADEVENFPAETLPADLLLTAPPTPPAITVLQIPHQCVIKKGGSGGEAEASDQCLWERGNVGSAFSQNTYGFNNFQNSTSFDAPKINSNFFGNGRGEEIMPHHNMGSSVATGISSYV